MSDTTPNTWDLCTNTAIRRAARRLGQLYDAAVAPAGLRGTQFTLLSQIRHAGDPTLRTLADDLVMDLSALGHSLKPLIRDGFVELVPDTQDRRAKRARLTLAGLRKQAEATLLWRDSQRRFDRQFGAAASAKLREALGKIASDDFAAGFIA